MALQATLIAVVAVIGIGIASIVIEQFLVREALRSESEHFWNNHKLDAAFPTPNTANLKGYLSGLDAGAGVPRELEGHGLGYHKMHGQFAHSQLFTTERNGERLYLLFDGKGVLRLSIYFGILPLTLILIMIYIVAWWVYRASNHLLSPIVWLANKFERFDPAHPDSSIADLSSIPGDIDWEVEKLVSSLSSYSRRIKNFVERERAFTRDASHEFRTPLTVIKMASDLLLAEDDLNKYSRKYGQRIKESAKNMEELIDAFLILARETDKEFDDEPVVIRELVEREVRDASFYSEDKDLTVEVREEYPLQLPLPRKVVSIVLGNLIRNAVIYTEHGSVVITIKENSVIVSDTGVGMCEQQIKRIFQPYYRANENDDPTRKGYGVGLTIVKRFSDRFNWNVSVQSEVGVGTSFSLSFS